MEYYCLHAIYHQQTSLHLSVFSGFFLTAYLLYYCERDGVDLMRLKPHP